MDSKRSVTPLLSDGVDLRATEAAFQCMLQQFTEPCYNGGKLLSTPTLHGAMYVQDTVEASRGLSLFLFYNQKLRIFSTYFDESKNEE